MLLVKGTGLDCKNETPNTAEQIVAPRGTSTWGAAMQYSRFMSLRSRGVLVPQHGKKRQSTPRRQGVISRRESHGQDARTI